MTVVIFPEHTTIASYKRTGAKPSALIYTLHPLHPILHTLHRRCPLHRKPKKRRPKGFVPEVDRFIPDSWIERFVEKQAGKHEALLPHKEVLVDICRDFLDATQRYKSEQHAFDKIKFTFDRDGNVDAVFVQKVQDYIHIRKVNPYYLLNLEKAIAERFGTKDKAYQDIVGEIKRRNDLGIMYPPKEENAA